MVTTYANAYSGFREYHSLDHNTVLVTYVIIPDATQKDDRQFFHSIERTKGMVTRSIPLVTHRKASLMLGELAGQRSIW